MTRAPANNLHTMVDIETMSTRPNAAILTIGAVHFDPRGEDTEESIRENEDHLFYCQVSLEANEAAGRHFSGGTIAWWMRQSQDAQEALLSQHATNLKQAMVRFRLFVANARPQPNRVWAKDMDFDGVILQDACRQVGEFWPFKFWEGRSVRTITELAYPNGDEPTIGVGTAHNALDDSIRQALMVQHCHHVLGA